MERLGETVHGIMKDRLFEPYFKVFTRFYKRTPNRVKDIFFEYHLVDGSYNSTIIKNFK